MAELVKSHAVSLKGVVDAQGAGDHAQGLRRALRTAAAHMQMVADPLAGARSPSRCPRQVPGATPPRSRRDLRVALNNALREHVVLAACATSAALGGRQRRVPGRRRARSTPTRWPSPRRSAPSTARTPRTRSCPCGGRTSGCSSTTPTGVATKDKAKQDKAVNDLVGYTQDFGAFLSVGQPEPAQGRGGRPGEVARALAQGRRRRPGEPVTRPRPSPALRKAAGHMQMVADPLAGAIVKQFPQKFAAIHSH